VPLTAFTVGFDPVVQLSETASVRLETVGLAIVLFMALVLAARAAHTSMVEGLRLDDLVFMVVGAVPGAIVGGRLGYVLDHLDYYRANTNAMLDPSQGSLTLTLAVPLGLLTGAVVGRLLRAPIAGWMQALALPLLFALAAGKLVGVLGASGQGLPTDVPWATAYLGAGPWGSIAADVPSHPSQVYEAILVGVAVVILGALTWTPFLRRADGSAILIALGLWAAARFVAASTWRDPEAVGPLRMDQALLLGVGALALAGLAIRARATAARTRPDQAGGIVSAAPDASPVEEPIP
jgi:phosphatidylglycerol:prolipoprotein diacylglycerol transferase